MHAGPMQGQPPARRLWPSGQRQYELCGLCQETQPGPRGSAQPGSKAAAQGLVPVRLSWQHGPVTAPTLCFTPSLSGWDNTLCLCRFPDMGEGTPGVSSPLGAGTNAGPTGGSSECVARGAPRTGDGSGVLPPPPMPFAVLAFLGGAAGTETAVSPSLLGAVESGSIWPVVSEWLAHRYPEAQPARESPTSRGWTGWQRWHWLALRPRGPSRPRISQVGLLAGLRPAAARLGDGPWPPGATPRLRGGMQDPGCSWRRRWGRRGSQC